MFIQLFWILDIMAGEIVDLVNKVYVDIQEYSESVLPKLL